MDPTPSSSALAPPTPASSPPSTHVRRYRPYFAPAEIDRLSAKQRGKLSVAREERGRQQACGFIAAAGTRCGLTIATAQMLYMRFHLFFPYKDFNYIEVSLSTLYVASKLHDTLKKPRDIILASYPIRFPHLLHPKKGTLDPAAIDAAGLEAERARVLGIERLILESVCFRFGVSGGGGGLEWAVKLGKRLRLSRDHAMQAWRVTVDCYRTPAPLCYAPHAIALGSTYACALLSLGSPSPHERSRLAGHVHLQLWADLAATIEARGSWEHEYHVSAAEANAIAQATLDLHITILSTPPSDPQHALTPSPSSPRDTPPNTLGGGPNALAPASGSISRAGIADTAFRLPGHWTVQTLTELKVYLRERAAALAPETMGMVGYGAYSLAQHEVLEEDGSGRAEDVSEGLGQNDGTTRFVWDHGVAA